MLNLLIIFTVGIGPSAFGKNSLLQMGGNCEEVYQRSAGKNIFLDPMTSVRNKMASQWDVSTLYDTITSDFKKGLKSNIQQIMDPASLGPSSVDAFLKKLDSLDQEAMAETAKGESSQVLLWMSSHGLPGKICLSGNEMLDYNDPRLKEHLDRLKQHAKLGFVNEACFSGSAMKELSQYGCTVTAQGSHFFSYGSPLSDTLKPGKHVSLSDLYLLSLANSGKTISSPQISGFSEGMNLTNADLDMHLDPSDALLEFPISFRSFRPLVCVNTATQALTILQASSIDQYMNELDHQEMKNNYRNRLVPEDKLQKKFQASAKNNLPAIKKFNDLSAQLFALTKSLPLPPLPPKGVIRMDATWFLPVSNPNMKMSSEMSNSVDSAVVKAVLASGANSRDVISQGSDEQPKHSIDLLSVDPNTEDFRQKGQLFLDTLESELKAHHIPLEKVMNKDDPSYQTFVSSFAEQGLSLSHRDETIAARDAKIKSTSAQIKSLNAQIDQAEKQVSDYAGKNRYDERDQFNQYLAYRYLESAHEPSLTAEEKAERQACDEFVIFK
jgi:hypothetical protein